MSEHTIQFEDQKDINQDNILLIPAKDEKNAVLFLDSLQENNIGFLGPGYRMWNLGISIPQIRAEYIRLDQQLANRLKSRINMNQYTDHQLAKWVVAERTKIANRLRIQGALRQGFAPLVIYETRDRMIYGRGGRSYPNMVKHAKSKGYKTIAEADQYLLKSAVRPNTKISSSSLKVGRYLKNGGRVAIVVGVAMSAHTILTAENQQLERVIASEAGSFIGGSIASGAAIGICLVFGIVTGGWGLLAVGIVAGVAGGAVGGYMGEKTYQYIGPNTITGTAKKGIIKAKDLMRPNWEQPFTCVASH